MTQSKSRSHAASSISNLMATSGVAFGTSGARGLVSAMADRVCFAYVLGFLQHLADGGEFARGGRVALAGDLRSSTPRIVRACVAAVRFAGGVPVYCGEVPAAVSEALLARLARLDDPQMAHALFAAECGAVAHIDLTDGVRMVFAFEDIAHLRASGNAPELRVYVEAGTPERAQKLLRLGMGVVTGWKERQACAP